MAQTDVNDIEVITPEFLNCVPGVLCKPVDEFDMIEKCMLCGKVL